MDWNQDGAIEKKMRNRSSMADKNTMSSMRESPGPTSVCCLASRLWVYVVATSAVSMRFLRGCYIEEGLFPAFYLSSHGII